MKKLLLTSLILLVACSKEIKKEEISKSCTYNGQAVDCSVLEGQNNVRETLTVESAVDFEMSLDQGKEFLTIKTEINKKVEGKKSSCHLVLNAEKLEVELYEKSRLILKNAEGEFEFKYKFASSRSNRSKYNGAWILLNEEDPSVKMVYTLFFNNDNLSMKLDCIPR